MTVKKFINNVPADAAALRQIVFVDEQGFVDEFDEYDKKALHYVMYDGDEPVATLRFYDEGGRSAHVGRVAVKKSRRGEGLGQKLMEHAFKEAKSLGFDTMTVSAQEDKSGFYSKCGFKSTGRRFLEQGCPHVDMVKKL